MDPRYYNTIYWVGFIVVLLWNLAYGKARNLHVMYSLCIAITWPIILLYIPTVLVYNLYRRIIERW